MAKPGFLKTVIGALANDVGASRMNTLLAVGDINGDGLPDVAVCGRNGWMVWFENPGTVRGNWRQHPVAQVENQECGGCIHDLTGSGRGDIINGSDHKGGRIQWWQNPGPAGGSASPAHWKMRVIADTSCAQFHDTCIGDVTGDGRLSLVFTNQRAPGGTRLCRIPLPQDPTLSPWPGLEVVAESLSETNPARPGGLQSEEGLATGDVDGDGRNEIVCGTHWHKYTGRPGRLWESHKFASGYITTKVAIGDVDGDGENEILLSEGDPCVYGKTQGGKLGLFKRTACAAEKWTEQVLMEGMLDAHSLQLGRLCGSGRLDILVGEIGVADRTTDAHIVRPPRLFVLENNGGGAFTEHLIDEGTGVHDAFLVDLLRRGVLDIVSKPLHDAEKWNVHVWYNQGR